MADESQHPDRDAERRQRAAARRGRITLRKTTLAEQGDIERVDGARGIELAARLTAESWSLAGLPWPDYSREEIPVRFVPRSPPHLEQDPDDV